MAISAAPGPKTIERVEVVPWSITRTCPVTRTILPKRKGSGLRPTPFVIQNCQLFFLGG